MKTILKLLIKIYQWALSPLLGPCCRFYPTCSQYALDALDKHGLWKGLILTIKRVVKCNPWHPGGIDLP